MPLMDSAFPEYVYREYPKFIQTGEKTGVIVNNAHEEAELAAQSADDLADTGDEGQEVERQALLEQCKTRGIKVHPKTGIEKLKAVLA